MANLGYFFLCSDASFEQATLDKDVFRKELIYPGHFLKKDSKGNVEFELPVDEALIDHWARTFKKMKAKGIEVPVPIEHTTDPELRRGTVVDLKKEFNKERNAPALFAYIKFRDPETAAKLSKTTQVSLFSPPDFVDGTGETFTRPIRHVALTDYPLVPALGGFEKTIAASLVSCSQADIYKASTTEGLNMISELADRLGVEYPEGASDADIMDLIESAWNSDVPMDGSDELEDLGDEVDPLGDEVVVDEEDPELSGMDDEDAEFDDGTEPMFEDDEDVVDVVPAASFSASANVVSQVAKARRTELEHLTRARKITPAVRDQLAAQFASPKQVSFSLSQTEGDDGFDGVIAALSLNKPVVRTGSRTGAQQNGSGGGVHNQDSPIVRDAQRRSENR